MHIRIDGEEKHKVVYKECYFCAFNIREMLRKGIFNTAESAEINTYIYIALYNGSSLIIWCYYVKPFCFFPFN